MRVAKTPTMQVQATNSFGVTMALSDIIIKKVEGKYTTIYFRLWDSPYNWAYPNHKENVIKAIAHCEKLNTDNGTSS